MGEKNARRKINYFLKKYQPDWKVFDQEEYWFLFVHRDGVETYNVLIGHYHSIEEIKALDRNLIGTQRSYGLYGTEIKRWEGTTVSLNCNCCGDPSPDKFTTLYMLNNR